MQIPKISNIPILEMPKSVFKKILKIPNNPLKSLKISNKYLEIFENLQK